MKNSFYNQGNRSRRGLTLIELLVVAGLMVLLISVAAPVLNPVAEGRQARETVRGIQSALESARSRALRLGRPCGVALSAFSTEDGDTWYPVCIQLEQLTAPPDIVTQCTVSGNTISVSDSMYENPPPTHGDLLQINYTGPWYHKPSGVHEARWSTDFPGTDIASEYPTGTYDCVIRRMPVSEVNNVFAKILGMDPVFVIPKGVVVDLGYSGVGRSGSWYNENWKNIRTVSVIFQPDGTVSLFLGNTEQNLSNTENTYIFLLVGRWDRGLRIAEDEYCNTQDPNSFWLVINSKTGMITSAINNAYDNGSIISAGSVEKARYFAIESVSSDSTKILGGR